jgi:hypothetical protein
MIRSYVLRKVGEVEHQARPSLAERMFYGLFDDLENIAKVLA